MRDSEIEQWVLKEIRLATGGRLQGVCVSSSTGVVNLKGTVDSRAERLAAQKAAKQATGVVRVINHLSVRNRNQVRRRRSAKVRVISVSGKLFFQRPCKN